MSLFFKDKKITSIFYNNKIIKNIYYKGVLIWETITSCFGKGFWINDNSWNNEDTWLNNY